MKLRAIITIDIEAADFVDAAEHQRKVETLLVEIRAAYADAELVFRERRMTARGSRSSEAATSVQPLQPTGRLSDYVE